MSLPSSVHLTASMLSSSHPKQMYEGSRTIVMQYGKTENGVSIGSLDLLGNTGIARPLILLHTATAVTGTGEAGSRLDVDMPPISQSLVIMNPPFTKPDSDWDGNRDESYHSKHFHGLSTDRETQAKMSALSKEYGKGTCAHGYAGIASWFVALADRMVRKDGHLAMVLPMTALQGMSWQKARQTIAQSYRDVTILTIAAARQDDQSFSADTGMAETLIVCREASNAPSGRGRFVFLQRRPDSEMEASEVARAVNLAAEVSPVRSLEGGPFGGSSLLVGDDRIGEMVDAPLSLNDPWSAVGIADFTVVQTACQLVNGEIWLPQMNEQDAPYISMTTLQTACQVGIQGQNIVGACVSLVGSQRSRLILKPTRMGPDRWRSSAYTSG